MNKSTEQIFQLNYHNFETDIIAQSQYVNIDIFVYWQMNITRKYTRTSNKMIKRYIIKRKKIIIRTHIFIENN